MLSARTIGSVSPSFPDHEVGYETGVSEFGDLDINIQYVVKESGTLKFKGGFDEGEVEHRFFTRSTKAQAQIAKILGDSYIKIG